VREDPPSMPPREHQPTSAGRHDAHTRTQGFQGLHTRKDLFELHHHPPEAQLHIHLTHLQKSQLGYVGEMLTEHFAYSAVSFERHTTTFHHNFDDIVIYT
jgi:hypothetical protein